MITWNIWKVYSSINTILKTVALYIPYVKCIGNHSNTQLFANFVLIINNKKCSENSIIKNLEKLEVPYELWVRLLTSKQKYGLYLADSFIGSSLYYIKWK